MSAPPPAYYEAPGGEKPGYPPQGQQAPYPPQGAYPTQQQPYPTGGPPQPYPAGGHQPYPGNQPYPPPGGPGYPTGPQGQQTTVVVAPPTIVVQHGMFGSAPMQTTCPSCHASVLTSVSHEVGALTWIIFAVLCLVGCWICAFIPFCVDDCKDVTHSCPNCKAVVGRYKRV